MANAQPFTCEIIPGEVEEGNSQVTLRIQNVGETDVRELNVRLKSTDPNAIEVEDNEAYLSVLRANEAQDVPFEIMAKGTGCLFATIDGERGGEPFHWESPGIRTVIGLQVAEIASLFAQSDPYPTLGSPVKVEATVRGLSFNQGLGLEFWVDTPNDTTEAVDKMPTDPVPEGEEKRYSAEFVPRREGIYVLHAYLYAGTQRIDDAVEYVSITR